MTDWRDKLVVKSTPPPKGNKYLRALYENLQEAGWSATRRGMPSFFCFKKRADGQLGFMAVLAIRKRTYRLRRHERAVAEALARAGVPTFRFNCDTEEYEEINFKPPAGVTPPGWRTQWAKEDRER